MISAACLPVYLIPSLLTVVRVKLGGFPAGRVAAPHLKPQRCVLEKWKERGERPFCPQACEKAAITSIPSPQPTSSLTMLKSFVNVQGGFGIIFSAIRTFTQPYESR